MGVCNTSPDNVNHNEIITKNFTENEKAIVAKKAKAGISNNSYADPTLDTRKDYINPKDNYNDREQTDADESLQDQGERIRKFEEMIKQIGFFSTEETMKATTLDFIIQLEEKENLNQFIEEQLKADTCTTKLLPKRVVQFFDGGFYSGTWNYDFKKHGAGTFLMNDGSKYCGSFVNDNIEGRGYYIDTKGKLYIGDFLNGKAHGKGKVTSEEDPGYCYEGDFVQNLFDGIGEERQPNGNCYNGSFKSGFKDGHGILVFTDGSSYDGNFVKSKIQGQGTFKWKDGRIYMGEFLDNKLDGKGKTVWVDGSFYEGDYKNDHFNGYGVLHCSDGSFFEGNWLNSMTHGAGFYKDALGEYKGIWRYNKNIKKILV